MIIDKDRGRSIDELRRHAEERLLAKIAETHLPRTKEETQRLVHELEVHQIELEMQNAALRQARDEAEQIMEKYSDLYDFAPVSYFTLDRDGVIREVNLTGASLIGVERARLLGRASDWSLLMKPGPFFLSCWGRCLRARAKYPVR